MMSLYAQYISEVANRHVIEEPHGFITYEIIGKVCYVSEFFIVKDMRGQGYGYDLFERVAKVAKAQGCEAVMGRVEVVSKTCNEALQLYLKCGAKLSSAEVGTIFVTKEI